ncbi:uncharacterized protein PHACADRAFT_259361 [Phanerochaete carnosa HHB-10118-sp]|uniref:Uncharacterized protein n=1 Tax=Phanerochaete carnosa (strain HHB-10118-sp) TaxID=650164 RepID=K5W238_PHACS|nr:uncharacterized protein PHACADRAFT_259361 [Phanerochaete carnosa HHB-10118-sp]EKM53185.1 hypothetical protein PHACADRAFT_259361 [Phanerochaete carnosa HHB-10118-sp]
MLPYRKRSSVWSVGSTGSSSSISTSTVASSPITTPGLLPITCSDVPEDADGEDEQPPMISISDEQVEEHPFDPSIPDEMYCRMMLRAASSEQSPPVSSTSGGFHERVSRLFAAHIPRRAVSPPNATAGSPSESSRPSGSWLSRLRPRRESHDSEEAVPVSAQASAECRARAQELATVISCTKRPSGSLCLVSLDQAQRREDIVHRPEGFELAERKDSLVSQW